ncbi:hypothetical protein [Bacillus sp. B1-b2]|uniref:hypothetical protein n=1 Tax=Bacillus sp. B1-b2 TaxID=2653201 RepID=UPI0012626A83|nr:hypothetical protein [Bacillus sp. B1-b2]KAB7673016.1 hypothetical protein F9279_00905 [Bacillus sp. B1-b2]
MRFLYKKYSYHEIETELEQVQNALSSNTYVFIDLIFASLIISLFIAVNLHSVIFGCVTFISCYILFSILYSLLLRWLKDPPEEDF